MVAWINTMASRPAKLTWRLIIYFILLLLGSERKSQRKGGASSGSAVHFNGPPVTLDDAVDDGQTQTRAFPGGFGGKKGLEDFISDIRGNSRARIRKGDHHAAIPGRRTSWRW